MFDVGEFIKEVVSMPTVQQGLESLFSKLTSEISDSSSVEKAVEVVGAVASQTAPLAEALVAGTSAMGNVAAVANTVQTDVGNLAADASAIGKDLGQAETEVKTVTEATKEASPTLETLTKEQALSTANTINH